MRRFLAVVAVALLAACSGATSDVPGAESGATRPDPRPERESSTTTSTTMATTTSTTVYALGQRVLPRRPDGFGQVLPTPAVLRDRRLPTKDVLPAPPGDTFASTVEPVARDVTARSTWQSGCPVTLQQLRYVTVTFVGFDRRPHTGELLVHAEVADGVVSVFRRLYEARFPIEEMRVVRAEELDLPPTGDGNNTTAFVCRPTRGSTSWSQHAYGLAVDVNPFHNPYTKGDLVLPELASAYTDRSWHRPGMIADGDPVTRAFAGIGWSWGGRWSSPKDPMHFSRSGT